jgi:hypothetical protein
MIYFEWIIMYCWRVEKVVGQRAVKVDLQPQDNGGGKYEGSLGLWKEHTEQICSGISSFISGLRVPFG